MTLPPESYDPRKLTDLEVAIEAAIQMISGSVDSTEQELTLQGLSQQASERVNQQRLEEEAAKEKLQSKINTLVAQVYSGEEDSPEKDAKMADFTRQFKVEPNDLDSEEMVIYYYEEDDKRSDYLDLSSRNISGQLVVPAELQVTKLNCYGNQLTALPELPAGLSVLDCHDNNFSDSTNAYLETRGFRWR